MGCKNMTRAIINEGLETVENGAFENSGLQMITFPSTLKQIKRYACGSCNKLGIVTFRKKSSSTKAEDDSLKNDFPGEICVPESLVVGDDVFNGCPRILVVWIEGKREASICHSVNNNTPIFKSQTMVRDKPLRDLRRQENISIPDDVQTIKSNWFHNCKAQSVTVPASVVEIEKEAFR